jgi:DNA-binding CsgD family transcriptional regulator
MVSEKAFSEILQRTLDLLGVGVAICDEQRAVIACTELAREIFDGFAPDRLRLGRPVPPTIARAATDTLPAGSAQSPVMRVETPDGSDAVYVSAFRVPEIAAQALALCLRREGQREQVLRRLLQERFAISAREFQLIASLRRGHSNKEIGATLGIQPSTVKAYLRDVFEKLGVRTRVELIALVEKIRAGDPGL